MSVVLSRVVCRPSVSVRWLSTATPPVVKEFISAPPELYRLSKPFSPPAVPEDVASRLNQIIDLSEQVHQLRLKRMQLLSLPSASVQGRNRELLSLAIGAVSGALSLSFHPAFALIFIVSYRMYRSASQPTRERLQGPVTVKDINREIADITATLDGLVEEIKSTQ